MSVSSVRRALPHVVRVLISSALLSAMFVACLYLYHTAFPFLEEHLLATEKKTTAWFAEQLSYSLPFVIICLYFTIVYRPMDKRDGVASGEKLWISVLVTVFTFAVLLPYVHGMSKDMYAAALEAGAKIPETDGKVPLTLMMTLFEWFLRLTIPMGILITFYGMRSSRERRGTDDTEEPLLTVEEYNARAKAAAEPDSTADNQQEVSHV